MRKILLLLALLIAPAIWLLASTLEKAREFQVWYGYNVHTIESFKEYEPANQPIDLDDPDIALLNAAVFYETNRRRGTGRQALIHSPALERAALMHAMDMAEHRFLSHNNPRDPQKRRFTQRIALFGATGAAENIALSFGIQYRAGTRVSGTADIPPHTYNSFAEAMLDQWMRSSGHRANILRGGNSKYLGCGVYPRPGDDEWHKYYGVQKFGSDVPDIEKQIEQSEMPENPNELSAED